MQTIDAFLFLVTVIPLIYGIYLTFTDWDGISSQVNIVGLTNYVGAFKDTAFFRALGLTVVYSAISVITINLIAFALAYVLTSGIKGQNFLEQIFHTKFNWWFDFRICMAVFIQQSISKFI